LSGQSPNMAFKKKLHKLSPDKVEEQVEIKIQKTKREQVNAKVTVGSNEREVRERLSSKISGSHMGIWLLIPEYLRLGTWDLLNGVFGNDKHPLSLQLAMQMVNESALCVNRIRSKDSLCNQGFSLANGLSFLATDESIHQLLVDHSMQDYEHMQEALLHLRRLSGHYREDNILLAIDPHRIDSETDRTMPKKKKSPNKPAKKYLQTFFCNDVYTGQPLGFTIAASGKVCSRGTLDLLNLIEKAGIDKGLIVADKEHFTKEISSYFYHHKGLDMLIPCPNTPKVKSKFSHIDYHPCWAGYYIGETTFSYHNDPIKFRMIVQREGEIPAQYTYKAFITTSQESGETLLTRYYSKRWKIEEFYNFEGDMGWNRASTFNLNIKYGKQNMALLAQAATYQLKSKLPEPYSKWTAKSLAEKVLTNMEGDIRVKDDKIIITYYKDHEPLGLRNIYPNLEQQLDKEGFSNKIPWLFNFKLEFRFK